MKSNVPRLFTKKKWNVSKQFFGRSVHVKQSLSKGKCAHLSSKIGVTCVVMFIYFHVLLTLTEMWCSTACWSRCRFAVKHNHELTSVLCFGSRNDHLPRLAAETLIRWKHHCNPRHFFTEEPFASSEPCRRDFLSFWRRRRPDLNTAVQAKKEATEKWAKITQLVPSESKLTLTRTRNPNPKP